MRLLSIEFRFGGDTYQIEASKVDTTAEPQIEETPPPKKTRKKRAAKKATPDPDPVEEPEKLKPVKGKKPAHSRDDKTLKEKMMRIMREIDGGNAWMSEYMTNEFGDGIQIKDLDHEQYELLNEVVDLKLQELD